MTPKRYENWHADAPLVIAHRGASLQAPENTLAAFRMSMELGADAIEMDAKLTVDQYVVMHHDLSLERTTDGTGRLRFHTLEDLKRLDAGSHFDGSFAGERIPTLEEVIETCGGDVLLNIELSNYDSPFDALPSKVIDIVGKHAMQSRVLLSSFNPVAVKRAHRMAPDIMTGLLIRPEEPRWVRSLFRLFAPHEAVHPHRDLVHAEMVARCHASGKRVFVWTVNTPSEISRLMRIGVNGIITDDPALARYIISD